MHRPTVGTLASGLESGLCAHYRQKVLCNGGDHLCTLVQEFPPPPTKPWFLYLYQWDNMKSSLGRFSEVVLVKHSAESGAMNTLPWL